MQGNIDGVNFLFKTWGYNFNKIQNDARARDGCGPRCANDFDEKRMESKTEYQGRWYWFKISKTSLATGASNILSLIETKCFQNLRNKWFKSI